MPFPFFPSQRRFRHQAHFENVLGTSLEIQLVSAAKSSGPRAETAMLAEIDRLSAIFNAYNPRSELSRWQSTFDEEVTVSAELAEVLQLAEFWRARSGGAFNPASEAFSRRWKRAESENCAVSNRELEILAQQIGGPLWEVDAARQTARRLTRFPATLNSIAKGFIIDRAAAIGGAMEGIKQILVNIGGDIRHLGTKNTAVAIADPRADAENAAPLCRLTIRDQGVATSGNYRRGFRVEGRWFSHLIDPRSGWPVEQSSGVSTLAPGAMLADVLATACSVLTTQEALKLADSLPAIGVLRIGANGEEFCNQFWRNHLQTL